MAYKASQIGTAAVTASSGGTTTYTSSGYLSQLVSSGTNYDAVSE